MFFSIGGADCSNDIGLPLTTTCCWETYDNEDNPIIECQTCILDLVTEEYGDCTPVEQYPASMKDDGLTLEEGVLQQQPPSEEGGVGAQPLTRGEGVLPQDGEVLQQPPADEGTQPPVTEETQPALVQEEPVPPCPEGQVLNEVSGLCVPEEPVAEEPQAEDEELQQESSEERDGSDGSNNEDNNN